MNTQGIMLGMNTMNIWSSCHTQLALDDNMTYLTKVLQAIPLTQALQALNPDFSVKVTHLGEHTVHEYERDYIDHTQGFAREVVLHLQNNPVVWARSVCAPDSHLWQDIVNCGTVPLGMRLYELPLKRTELQWAYLTPNHPANPTNQIIVSRRSCFYLQDDTALLLTESFLPTLQHYIEKP